MKRKNKRKITTRLGVKVAADPVAKAAAYMREMARDAKQTAGQFALKALLWKEEYERDQAFLHAGRADAFEVAEINLTHGTGPYTNLIYSLKPSSK